MSTPTTDPTIAAVEARAAELERQAEEAERRANLEITALRFAAQELRHLAARLNTPPAPDAE